MAFLRSHLRTRRDLLPKVARDFYDWLATEVDVHATDEADRVVVDRLGDGRVTVTIHGKSEPQAAPAFFSRTFDPKETREVRVYLHGANDVGIVRGASADDIDVRLIGGGDDDFLADSAGGGGTHFYDEKGKNTYVRKNTTVSEKEWKVPRQGGGIRFDAPWRPDWGRSISFGPAIHFVEGGGLVAGIGPRYRVSGFRRLPHKLEAGGNILIATGSGLPGLDGYYDYRFENSPNALLLDARATRYEAFRFFGYGNNSPKLSRAQSLVNQDLIAIEPMFVRQIGWREREDLDSGFGSNAVKGASDEDTVAASKEDKQKKNLKPGDLRPLIGKFFAGPIFRWNRTHPNSLVADAFEREMTRAGALAELELDKTSSTAPSKGGFRLLATATAYPALFDIDEVATTARAAAAAYVPFGASGLSAAFRLGGAIASGDIPVQEAPFIGGRTSVRGYSSRRFIGDAAAFGSAEIRVPLSGTFPLLINWNPGVFGLVDAGRVWLDGDSPGKWHAGFGGGVWLSALGQSFSIAFAHGDSNRFYLQKGMSF
jgi:hypothetical protein